MMITTPRLILRPMHASDFAALLLIFRDLLVMAAFNHPPFTDEQMHAWLQRNLDHQAHYGYGLYAIIEQTSGDLIGDCGLEMMELDDGTTVAELGYDLRSNYWGRGYATEAALAVREYAFTMLNLPRLISLIRVGNLASQAVARKIGMKLTNTFMRGDVAYWQYEISNHRDHKQTIRWSVATLQIAYTCVCWYNLLTL